MMVMLNGDAFRRMVVSRLETGRHPNDGIHSVLVKEESNSMFMSVFTATEKELVAFWDKCFSKYFPESDNVPSVSLNFVG